MLSLPLYLYLCHKSLHAQELKILPEKDAYVDSESPDKNFGRENIIPVAFTHTSKITFLKFNLENIAKDSQPQQAILNLQLNQSQGDLKPIQTEVLLPSCEWNENEINWNNKPSLYKTDLTITLEATPGAQKIDITPLVNQWLNGAVHNYGFALYQNGESFERVFSSREDEKSSPTLTFSWVEDNQGIGGLKSLVQEKTKNLKALEAFPLEKEATQTATLSGQQTEKMKTSSPEEETKPSTINHQPSAINLINSKNIIILILGLLAIGTLVIEKLTKNLRGK